MSKSPSKTAAVMAAISNNVSTKNTHGGPGRGQGLKASDGATGLKRTNISIDPASVKILRGLGDGDLSLGIRRAAANIKNECCCPHLRQSLTAIAIA